MEPEYSSTTESDEQGVRVVKISRLAGKKKGGGVETIEGRKMGKE